MVLLMVVAAAVLMKMIPSPDPKARLPPMRALVPAVAARPPLPKVRVKPASPTVPLTRGGRVVYVDGRLARAERERAEALRGGQRHHAGADVGEEAQNAGVERHARGVSHTAETGRAVVGEIDGVGIAVGVVVDGELGAWVDNESCRVQGCAGGLEQHGAAVDDR